MAQSTSCTLARNRRPFRSEQSVVRRRASTLSAATKLRIRHLPKRSKSLIRAGSLTSGLSRVQGEIARDKLAALMPQFVIEREVPGAGSLSEDQIRELSLRSLETLKTMGPQIQWLHSYVTEDKVYCVYLAPDEESIRQHARRTGIPADRVSAVRRLIDPAKLR